MRYLLDTDIVSYLLREERAVSECYRTTVLGAHELLLSPFVHYEATRYLRLKGAHRLARAYAELIVDWVRLRLDDDDWDMAADPWAERHRLGRPIEDSGLLVAVGALRADAVLVTNNARHFEGLGLRVENWAEPAG